MSPTKWIISGDKDRAIRLLKGLGLNWLYKVKNWRKLGNLNWFDSGWKNYKDGGVRVVSFGNYDKIYLNAGGVMAEEEMKLKAGYIYSGGYDDSIDVWIMEKRSTRGKVLWTVRNDVMGDKNFYGYNWVRTAVWGPIACAVDSTGVYYVNNNWANWPKWRLEKRNKSDGSVIYQVDNALSDMYGSGDDVFNMASDGRGNLYIVGDTYLSGDTLYRPMIVKVDANDGSIVWSQVDTSLTDDATCLAVCIRGDYLYNASLDPWMAAGKYVVVQKRRIDNGSIVWDKRTTDVTWGTPNDTVVDGTGLYLACVYYDQPTDKCITRITKRDIDTGEIIWEYDKTDFSSGTRASLYEVNVDQRYIYATGRADLKGPTFIICVDKTDGTLIWEYTASDQNTTHHYRYLTPNVINDDYIFTGGGNPTSSEQSIFVNKKSDGSLKETWTSNEYYNTPLSRIKCMCYEEKEIEIRR